MRLVAVESVKANVNGAMGLIASMAPENKRKDMMEAADMIKDIINRCLDITPSVDMGEMIMAWLEQQYIEYRENGGKPYNGGL